MKRPSARYTPAKWFDRLVPIILILLVLAMLTAFALILLSSLGVLH